MVNAIARPTTIPIPTLVASERPSGMSGLSVPISSTLLTCRDSSNSFSMFGLREGMSYEKVCDACWKVGGKPLKETNLGEGGT